MLRHRFFGIALGLVACLLAPTAGRAADPLCATCHGEGTTAAGHHAQAGYTCGQCHAPSPIGSCSSCHTDSSFFHHGLAAYSCTDCHGAAFGTPDCASCHSATTPTTGHHDPAVLQTRACLSCHTANPAVGSCLTCHTDVATLHASCLTCHAQTMGTRRPVGADFAAASHHVKNAAPTRADCSACHDLGTHMAGTVWLRNSQGGPVLPYSDEASATPFCLSCHDEDHKAAQPFSDGLTPSSSAWDGASVALKFTSAEVVSSNKYPPTTPAPNMGGQPYNTVPDVTRALSAHGNPAGNQANGSDLDAGVPCLGCHNAHGSPLEDLLFSNATYQPDSEEDLCWDCHTNDDASPHKAWDYLPNDQVRDYWGEPRWGMNDGTGFKADWMGSFAYKDAPFKGSHFYPSKRKISDTNWPRSTVTCTSCHDPHGVNPNLASTKSYMVPLLKGTWLISPYKEDRAPLASFASALRDGTANRYQNADQPRSSPDLPYNNAPNPGGGYANGTGGAGHEGYFIDDNTFGTYNPATLTPAQPQDWKNVLASGQTLQVNRIAEPDDLFAGLCLQCHAKTDLVVGWSGHGTVKGWGGAKRDLFPRTLVGSSSEEGPGNSMHSMGGYASSESEENAPYARGYRWGVNPRSQQTTGYVQADYHQFTCSKCHSPHATNMPRLLVTNCLDSKGSHSNYPKAKSAQAATCHSTQRNLPWTPLTPWAQTEGPTMYTIMATSTAGGTITPAGNALVASGDSQAFTITPDFGYSISYVKVDGVSQGAITSYTFDNVNADHTINTTFTSPNLAQGKTATASSTRSGGSYTAAMAVDDNTATSWMSSTTSSAQWVRVDLGSSQTVSFVTVAWPATYFAKAFQVQTSTDGTNFATQYSATNATGTTTYATFAPVSARYVRVYCTTRNNSSYYGVSEVRVFAAAPHNEGPTANAGVDKTGKPGTALTFGGGGSDSDGTIVSYSWSWGDGSANTNTQNASHTYAAEGVYTVTLTVADNQGATGMDEAVVSIAENQPPVADAGADTTGTAGAALSFAGTGSDIDGTIAGYSWNWGDGTADTNAQSASHAYAAPGTYFATLTVTDNLGAKDTDLAMVTIAANQPPVADAGPDKTGTAGGSILFIGAGSDADGSVVDYSWNWGDGTPGTNTQSASHVYASAGTYTATLTATDNLGATGTDAVTVTVALNYPPVAEAGPNKTGTAGAALSFAGSGTDPDGTIVSYSWSWGDGTPNTNTQNASHTYAAAGTYTVTLRVTDNAWATGSDTAVVTIAPNQPPVANAGADKAGTAGTAIAFTGSGTDAEGTVAGYSWNWGDGSANTDAQDASHTYAAAGTYTATLTVTDNLGATGTDTAMVAVAPNQPPVADAGTDKTGAAGTAIAFTGSGTDSDGTIASYSWTWGDGSASTGTQNASHTYAAAGTYTATLTVTDNLGATGTDTAMVAVAPNQPPVANAGTDKTGTAGTAVAFTGAGTDADGTIESYSWNWGDGSADTGTQDASHTYAAAGTYTATLTVTDNAGATGTDTALVTVNAVPVNVALNKTASASSQYSSTYSAAKAVDGSTSTYWRSSSTGTQWLLVNLGSNFNVSRVKASWSSTYYARSFQIQTSLDGTNFTTQYSTTSGGSTPADVTFPAVTARYARVYCTTANSSSYRVTELEVYGTAAPNQPPSANAGSDKAGYVGSPVSFTGSGTDPDGTIAGYSWNWGDGTADTNAQNASHAYAAVGTYTATLTVADDQGATGSDTAVVTVSEPPPNAAPTANAGTDKTGSVGTAISFTGSGADADGTIAGYSWSWGDGTADTNTQNASHTYTAAGTYTATLTVTDNLGAAGTDAALVTVNAVPVNIALNKTASASSQYSSTYSAAKAVDGSTSTYWRSSSTGTQWLRVDLGSNANVSRVKVSWNSSYYAKSFQVQTSLDGANFTTQYSTASGGSTPADVTFSAAEARYVRVYCTTANSSSYRITELEVYP